MVGYVCIRDLINRKSIDAQIAAESNEPFEEIEYDKETLEEYLDHIKKTA